LSMLDSAPLETPSEITARVGEEQAALK